MASEATPLPAGLSRRARTLAMLTRVVAPHVSRATASVLRRHLMTTAAVDDACISAFDAFEVDGNVDALLDALNAFVEAEVARGSEAIGTPLIARRTRSLRLRSGSIEDAAAVGAAVNPVDDEGESSSDDAAGAATAASARRAVLMQDGRHARVTGVLAHAPSMEYSPVPGPFVSVSIVYYAPEMRAIAKELASGRAAGAVALREVDWGTFPDGFPNLLIRSIKDCRFNHVLFLASFHSPSAIIQQMPIVYALPTVSKHFTAVVPFFPTGTMERVQVLGEVATAKTLARMLSATPLASGGPASFCILDIHALAVQFFFGDGVHTRLKSCIALLHDALLALPDAANVVIAFPDDGAFKRFHGKLEATFGEPVVCTKRRDGDRRHIVINHGDPRGKHVCIVDDLVQTGGTLLECAKALKDAGAAKVSAYVTHAVFPNDSYKKFLATDTAPSPLTHFFITNSIPTTATKLQGVEPFRILSITPILEDLLGV